MDAPAKKRREWRVRVSVSRRDMRVLAAFAVVCLLAADLSTESLTLTTYYPAPYGAYKELRATEDAYFAYLGATGKVGIGTASPAMKLDVMGSAGLPTGGATPTGAMRIWGDANNTAIDFGVNGVFGWIQATDRALINQANPLLLNPQGGQLVVNRTTPLNTSIYGNAAIVVKKGGYIYLESSDTSANGCRLLAVSNANFTGCTPNVEFATLIPGIYQTGTNTLGRSMLASFNIEANFDELLSQTATITMISIDVKNVGSFYCCKR